LSWVLVSVAACARVFGRSGLMAAGLDFAAPLLGVSLFLADDFPMVEVCVGEFVGGGWSSKTAVSSGLDTLGVCGMMA
jgi:hypothetical protein